MCLCVALATNLFDHMQVLSTMSSTASITRSIPSTSQRSNAFSIKENPYFYTSGFPHTQELYNLWEIAKTIGLGTKKEIKKKHLLTQELSDDALAALCIEKLAKTVGLDVDVKYNCEIPLLKTLSALDSKTIQRPDVIVFLGAEKTFCLSAQVKSGSKFEATMHKAALGAADCIRMLRYSDKSISTLTTFALPNGIYKDCIVEIEVKFDSFRFTLKATVYQEINDGLKRITDVMTTQKSLPCISPSLLATKY